MPPVSLKAAQLVYSNVEAQHSPTGQRGCQVWLCSRRLADREREIAGRLEDFEWPPADALVDRRTRRLSFFPITGGEFVIAQSVPLVERDVGNRGGRFHAHAIILPAAEFARIGYNPFAVFDQFNFQMEPDEAGRRLATGADRAEKGVLPDETAVFVGKPDDRTDELIDPATISLLVRWLAGPDDPRPVAIPSAPDRVSGFLRGLFRILPPKLRVRASFDTLSAGRSLDVRSFRFVGAFDLSTLRGWAYRRSYRLDIETRAFLVTPEPPPDPAMDHLARAWLDSTLTDDDREGSRQLLRAVVSGNGKVPTCLTDRAVELVRSAPGFTKRLSRCIRRRLVSDMPFERLHPLLQAKAEEWVCAAETDAVRRLFFPVPSALMANWLFEQVEAKDFSTNIGTARELVDWSGQRLKDPSANPETLYVLRQLHLIGLRWVPKAAGEIRKIRKDPKDGPAWSVLIDGWLPDWLRRRSPAAISIGDVSAIQKLTDKVFSTKPDEGFPKVDEIELLLEVTDPPPGTERLRFAVAFHRADATGMADLLGRRDDVSLAGWAVDWAVRLGLNLVGCVRDVGSEAHPGIAAIPPHGAWTRQVAALIEAFAEHSPTRTCLLDEGVSRILKKADDARDGKDTLTDARRYQQREQWSDLWGELAQVSTRRFREFLQDVPQKGYHPSDVTAPEERAGDGIWLGVRPIPAGQDRTLTQVWKAAIRAARTAKDRQSVLTAAILGALRAPR